MVRWQNMEKHMIDMLFSRYSECRRALLFRVMYAVCDCLKSLHSNKQYVKSQFMHQCHIYGLLNPGHTSSSAPS